MLDAKADVVDVVQKLVVRMDSWYAIVDTAGGACNDNSEVALDCDIEDGWSSGSKLLVLGLEECEVWEPLTLRR